MIGAMATGTMKTMACHENDIFAKCGIWNHGAEATALKSIELL